MFYIKSLIELRLLIQDRTHFMRFVVLSKSHFSNELHFTLPQKLPEPPLELSERLIKFLLTFLVTFIYSHFESVFLLVFPLFTHDLVLHKFGQHFPPKDAHSLSSLHLGVQVVTCE